MKARASVVAAVAIAAVAATGCGDDGEADVRAAFDQLRQAWIGEDYGAVCTLLSAAARREVGALGHGETRGCRADVAEGMPAKFLSRRDRVWPPIETIDVDGDRATARALLGGTTPGDVRFVREGGEWKLAQLFGTTAPPPRDMR